MWAIRDSCGNNEKYSIRDDFFMLKKCDRSEMFSLIKVKFDQSETGVLVIPKCDQSETFSVILGQCYHLEKKTTKKCNSSVTVFGFWHVSNQTRFL